MQLAKILAVLAAGICLCTGAFAQTYPARPVRVIVPFAPGGGVDAIIRIVALELSEMWAQPVTVENHVGSGGTVGAGMVARSPADGYTLLANSSAHVVSAALRANLPYDPLKDFVPIAPLTSQAYILVVGKSAGVKTVRDLISAAKAKPGELKFTSAGIGSGTHLMAEKFNLDAGVKMVHVPTAGAGAANDEVIAGRVTYWFSSITPAFPHILAGRLLALGVSSTKRLSAMPEVPTVAEAGVAGFDSTLWYGMWAPVGTPNAVVDTIAKDVARVLAGPDLREQLGKLSAEIMSMPPAEFARFVRSEAESVARIVTAAGIKPQ
jgi:tripartite-type tricarboxylate transporter receptor subunit TctC